MGSFIFGIHSRVFELIAIIMFVVVSMKKHNTLLGGLLFKDTLRAFARRTNFYLNVFEENWILHL